MNRNVSRKLKPLCVLAAALLGLSFIHTPRSDARQAQAGDGGGSKTQKPEKS